MSDHSFLPAWREQSLGRRLFLRVSAASAASVALVAAGCTKVPVTPAAPDPYKLPLPVGDQGILFYAYLLAIAKATTYQKVVDAPAADLTAAERAIFADLRDHSVVHRQLLKYLLDPTGANVLYPAGFVFNLTAYTLTTRAGVLAAALQLEDLTAATYPTILPRFASADKRNLLLKMSSVHARHAATLRDLLTPGSFANSTVVNAQGQLITKTPTEVIAVLAPFIAPYIISITCPDEAGFGLCNSI
jgi:hypothetical protein